MILPAHKAPAWAFKIMESLQEQDEVTLVGVGLDFHAPKKRTHGSSLIYRTYEKLEKRLSRPLPDAFAEVDCSSLISKALLVDTQNWPATSWSEHLDRLALDVIVWLKDYAPPPQLSTHASNGVWFLEMGNGNVKPGFWEVVEKQATSHIELVVDRTEKSQVIYRSKSGTNAVSVSQNRNNLMWQSCSLFGRMLKGLQRQGPQAFFNQHDYLGNPGRHSQGNLRGVGLLASLASLALRRTQGKLGRLVLRERWRIYFSRGPGFPSEANSFQVLESPSDRFWADPFPVKHLNQHYIFFEELRFKDNMGYLMVIPINEDGPGEAREIIRQPYHLSFPFIFSHQGRFFMIPESRQDKTLQLWEASSFPYEWRFSQYLMRDVEVVDTTVHYHQGRWWLFTCMVSVAGGSSSEELYLFSSNSLESANWTPHPANPVVSDVCSARNAGRIIQDGGQLFRPSQDCSQHFGKGGQGVSFQEIVTLTPTEYKEVEAGCLKPDSLPLVKRIHSYNCCEGLVVVDGLIPSPAWRKL